MRKETRRRINIANRNSFWALGDSARGKKKLKSFYANSPLVVYLYFPLVFLSPHSSSACQLDGQGPIKHWDLQVATALTCLYTAYYILFFWRSYWAARWQTAAVLQILSWTTQRSFLNEQVCTNLNVSSYLCFVLFCIIIVYYYFVHFLN